MNRIAGILLLCCLFSAKFFAQKLDFGGYVKDMQTFYFLQNGLPISPDEVLKSTNYNLIHNRLNLVYTPVSALKFELGVRNRLLAGKMLKQFPVYANYFETDDGIVDLSWNWAKGDGFFANTAIDRLFADYTWQNIELRVGRQRINWGMDLVWNPNDLFNAFSYIDFDYEERPGSDAALLTWYSSASSSLDVAFKTDKFRNTTVAGRYRFNFRDYDIQFIGGKSLADLVLGGGWSGAVRNVSFRGEGSVFIPAFKGRENSETSVSATVSADYTFENSLYTGGAFLFNSMGKTGAVGGISLLNPDFNLSAKNLSLGRYEIFAQCSYPLSPIMNTGFAAMLNPSDFSAYLAPNCTFSLANDFELLISAQLMVGGEGTEYGSYGNTYACYARLRWSF